MTKKQEEKVQNVNEEETKKEKAPKSRFQKLSTERYMYNTENATAPLIGYLVDCLDMPPIRDKPWSAFLIRTTEPTVAMNREKEMVDVGVGEEVLVPATYQLSQMLTKAASHPTLAFEVSIKPDKQIKLDGGQKMWTFEIGVNPNPIPLRQVGGSAAILSGTKTVRALPAAGVQNQQSETDIPF